MLFRSFTNSYFTPYVEGFGNVTPFSTTTSYKLRDVVNYSGNAYLAATSGIAATTTTPNAAPGDWDLLVSGISTTGIGTWNALGLNGNQPYPQGSVVTFGGNTYIAIASSVPIGVKPEGDSSYIGTSTDNWSIISHGLRNAGTWSTSTTYYRNEVVTYTSSSYIGIVTETIGNQPDVSPGQWQQLAAGEIGRAHV